MFSLSEREKEEDNKSDGDSSRVYREVWKNIFFPRGLCLRSPRRPTGDEEKCERDIKIYARDASRLWLILIVSCTLLIVKQNHFIQFAKAKPPRAPFNKR